MELDQLGKYRILGKLGQGAMGVVYKAYDPVLHRFVAVKTLSRCLEGEDFRARFRREAQRAGQLNHPNIVTIYDFGEAKGRVYMAMELLEGVNLRRLIELRVPLPVCHRLRILSQICDGLAFAHSRGVVHRDLKPSNIHLQITGHVKIVDFGLARLSSAEPSQPGVILGTPCYMAPEHLQGEPAEARSDVFSLGVVFYELLSYHKPFEADSFSSLLYKVAEALHKPLRDLCPELPEPLCHLVERALAKDPAERFENAGEVRTALARAIAGVGEAKDVLSLEAHLPAGVAGVADSSKSPVFPLAEASESLSVKTCRTPSRSVSRPPVRSLFAAMALVWAIATIAFWWGRRSVPSPLGAEVQELRRELLESLLAEAQMRLYRNDLEGALDRARRATRLDPTAAEAKELEARASEILARRIESEKAGVPSMSPVSLVSAPATGGDARVSPPVQGVGPHPHAVWAQGCPARREKRPARVELATPETPVPVEATLLLAGSAPWRETLQENDELPPRAEPPPALSEGPVRVTSQSPEAIPQVKVAPAYPAVAARSRTEGDVLLEVAVDRAGSPSAIRVLRTSPLFEKAALEAVKRWRWKPYTVEGIAVPFVLTVSVEFRLEG